MIYWPFTTPTWWQERSITTYLLRPLSYIYYTIFRLRRWIARPLKLSVPVICVGNATAGGAGKTPFVIYLLKYFQERNVSVACVSKGYGGKLTSSIQVDPSVHDAYLVGDEPLLLAKIAPTFIGKNRKRTLQLAEGSGADLIIMDDGYQNPTVSKDFHFLVVDGTHGIGNGLLLPAGPLRETFDSAIAKAHAVIIMGEKNRKIEEKIQSHGTHYFYAHYQTSTPPSKNQSLVAFSGIANPDKFFNFLRSFGATLQLTRPFPDHYMFSHHDLQSLLIQARSCKAKLITTEKDWIRLPEHWQKDIDYCPITLGWEDEGAITGLLHGIYMQRRD